MSRMLAGAVFLALLSEPAAGGPAQVSPTSRQEGIEDTLAMLQEADQVVAASRHSQPLREAPSAVTVVTAAEIRTFGYRTLGEVLAHCRGFFVTYDRNYSYVGARGFSRTGDYNARVLVLLNGQRLNDNVYGAVAAGNDFPVDLDMVSRIEIVRGPGSALYGSNALFAVINIITLTPAEARGSAMGAGGGSYGTGQAFYSYGSPASGSPSGAAASFLLSGSVFASQGQDLFYPEFRNAGSGGLVIGSDSERTQRAFLAISRGNLSVQAGWAERMKEVPTASFATVFNDGREKTTDGRALLSGVYERPFGSANRTELRLSYDRFWYSGDYPYNTPPLVINKDLSRGEWISASGLADLHGSLGIRTTLGAEYVWNRQVFQRNYDRETAADHLNDDHPFSIASVFAQGERSFGRRTILSLGARYDRPSNSRDSLNPRFSAVFMPGDATTIKFLAGRAFRTPNAYELYYHLPGIQEANDRLFPERIVTSELLWEQRLGSAVQATFSVYRYRLKGLINQSYDPARGALFPRNAQPVDSNGAEAELRFRLPAGASGDLSLAYADADVGSDLRFMPGSPRFTGSFGLVAPLVRTGLDLAPTLRYAGRQRTFLGGTIGSYGILDLTLTNRRPWRGLRFSASVRNAANKHYGDVGGPEFIQETIAQDGRSFRVTGRYAF